jgi:predicted transcriptional regulator
MGMVYSYDKDGFCVIKPTSNADIQIDGRSLTGTIQTIDILEDRVNALECVTSTANSVGGIGMKQVSGLEDAFYKINVSIGELEKSIRELEKNFRDFDQHICLRVERNVDKNRMDLDYLWKDFNSLSFKMAGLESKNRDMNKRIDTLEEGCKKKGEYQYFNFADYFEKMNFNNRAIGLNRMALNTILKGTM